MHSCVEQVVGMGGSLSERFGRFRSNAFPSRPAVTLFHDAVNAEKMSVKI